MIKTGPNSTLLVNGEPGEGHYVELVRQWRWLDFFLNPNVVSVGRNSPPSSPVDGEAYIVGDFGDDLWAGHSKAIARWSADTVPPKWEFIPAFRGGCLIYGKETSQRFQFNGTDWEVFSSGGGGGGGGSGVTSDLIFAASDLTTPLTAGIIPTYAPAPRTGTIGAVKANLRTASTTGPVHLRILKNGVSILSAPIVIDVNEKTSLTGVTPPVVSDNTVTADDIFTVEVINPGVGARGLFVSIVMSIVGEDGGGGTWGTIVGLLSDQVDLANALAEKASATALAALAGRVTTLEQSQGKYVATIGNGSAAEFDVQHDLGTRNVHVTVYRTDTPYDTIICDVDRTTEDSVKLYGFSGAPSSAQYTVIVSA